MRPDFKKVETNLERLEVFAAQAYQFNLEEWPHLKSESKRELYQEGKGYEMIYNIGRDCSVWMASRLGSFCDVGEYPTLKSFVDSIEGTLADQTLKIEDLVTLFHRGEQEWRSIWGINEMVSLCEKQIAMLKAARDVLIGLKDSNLYRQESGLSKKMKKGKQQINISGPANVQIGDYNQQEVVQTFNGLIKEIEDSDAPQEEKDDALLKLKTFLNLPLVASVVGGALGGLVGLG